MKKERRYLIPFGSIWDAYYKCVKNKRNTLNAMSFNLNLERNLTRLWKEINDRTYEIGRSIAFIVEHPVKREVFAADFRDRIVHDWICMRLEPIFERVLPDCMMSNRIGKGTLAAIRKVYDDIAKVSEGYSRDCWIWKFDLSGFFMSIDKRLLNAKIQGLINCEYHRADKDTLRWLTEKVIMHCPQNNCLRKSLPGAWVGLRKNKSLFEQDKYHGIPIGNLPSQEFANYYLSDMVWFMKTNGITHTTQYVDDNTTVHHSKDEILAFIPKLRTWLWDALGIRLHPKKCYLQHYTKGVPFVGGIIKPHRLYVSKRTARKMRAKTHWLTSTMQPLKDVRASINSYFGHTRYFSAYKLRYEIMQKLFNTYHDSISFNNNIYKLITSTPALESHGIGRRSFSTGGGFKQFSSPFNQTLIDKSWQQRNQAQNPRLRRLRKPRQNRHPSPHQGPRP